MVMLVLMVRKFTINLSLLLLHLLRLHWQAEGSRIERLIQCFASHTGLLLKHQENAYATEQQYKKPQLVY